MASRRGRGAVRPSDLDARTVDMTEAAAECRMMRHAWPRRRDPNYATLVTVTVTARNATGQARVIEQVMTCATGCGTAKTVQLGVDPKTGRAERLSAYYRYAEGYLLKAADPDATGPVDAHELQFLLLHRIYPDLQW